MLTLHVGGHEIFNEATQQFGKSGTTVVELEHSLASLSKWESLWEKPFLVDTTKTNEETLGYVKAMLLTPDVSPDVFQELVTEHMEAINNYIGAKMTATWFSDVGKKGPNSEIITSEVIYYWMITHNIPFECQHWHLNKLLTLIRVCNQKNAPKKSMSKQEIAQRQRDLNAQRRAQFGTSG